MADQISAILMRHFGAELDMVDIVWNALTTLMDRTVNDAKRTTILI